MVRPKIFHHPLRSRHGGHREFLATDTHGHTRTLIPFPGRPARGKFVTRFAGFLPGKAHDAGSTIFINMAGNYHVGYLPAGQTWFSGDNVVGGKNLFVCVRLCGSVANIIFPQRSFSMWTEISTYLKVTPNGAG